MGAVSELDLFRGSAGFPKRDLFHEVAAQLHGFRPAEGVLQAGHAFLCAAGPGVSRPVRGLRGIGF